MKRNKFNILTGTILLIAFLSGSCESWIDPDINVSENSPTDVTLPLLLPSTQASLFYVLGGDHSRIASIFMQHQAGVDRQAAAHDVYNYTESDCNNLYNTLSASVMQNLVNMRKKSLAPEGSPNLASPHYEGVANVLTAFTLGEMTDVWGDVPYYEAFQADVTGNKTPGYNSQQDLYAVIDSLLLVAINRLSAPSSYMTLTSTSDKIYSGGAAGLANWRRAAWTLRLRYALHLQKRSGDLTNILSILNDPTATFFTANAQDFQFTFGTASTERGPRYNFESSRGDIRAGKFLVDLMNATNDPRRAAYFTQVSGAYVGSAAGDFRSSASRMGRFYAQQQFPVPSPAPALTTAPVPVLTYVEYLFIVSEVRFREGDLVQAATFYNNAVAASLAKHNIVDAAWLAVNAAETDVTITLDRIMTAKYIGLYLQSEVWSDWRRTGLPNIQPAIGASTVGIPRRLPYPLNERLYNPNTPAGLDLMTRVYWDME